MNLQKIANQFQSQPTSSKPVFNLKALKPLSNEEASMIEKNFPAGANPKLELYFSSGQSRTEIPGGKGQNFDFRV